MIFITGDCHGDYRRFNTAAFPEQKEMTKEDYVIICGDFGFWDTSKQQENNMDWLEEKPFTTLWVDGNHENFDLLSEYPVDWWNGGKVQFVRPSIIHLMRGQIFDIGGESFFTFGGARSHDIDGGILEVDDPQLKQKQKRLNNQGVFYRINHVSWWKEEMPSQEEMTEGIDNLKQSGYKVDNVITHCCPTWLEAAFSMGMYSGDTLTDYFNTVSENVNYKHWFFGHYHDDRRFDEKHYLLYEQIVRIN